jgi:hypothetical protein
LHYFTWDFALVYIVVADHGGYAVKGSVVRLNTGIMESNPTQNKMSVCTFILCLCCPVCR